MEGFKTLRILHLEDDPLDVELVRATLEDEGVSCEVTQVQTREDFEAVLEENSFDLVLADYSLPAFDGLSALKAAQEVRPEVPFVLVSGTLGEERAVEALKSGATDYVLKHRLERLVPAVLRAVEEAEERTERKRAEEGLAESRRQLKELVGKLLTAQEEERRKVAYDIHDGLTQIAVAVHQHLQAFAHDHPPGSKVREGELDRLLTLAREAVKESRRVIEGLRPAALDDFGLAVALGMHIEELEKNEALRVDYEDGLGEERLPTEVETALYRVAQEALTNAQKYAQTKKVHLTLERLETGKVRLEVSDEGRGFDPSSRASGSGGAGPGERVGLASMQERVSLVGGELTIRSRPGAGTSVIAEVPLSASKEEKGGNGQDVRW